MGDNRAEIRKDLNALTRISMGGGFRNEGATADTAPPDYVRQDADPDLCKEALQRLSRHMVAEIQKLVEEDKRFESVFIGIPPER